MGMVEAATTDASRRLLLVEDDHDLAHMLAELLRDSGYSVDTAGDGQRGLHLALSDVYQVILIDRRLPVIEGVDVVARLRRRGVSARVLVMTALGDTADRVNGLDAGADDYLVKPFEVAELMARVRALGRRSVGDHQVIPLGNGQLDLAQRGVQMPDGRTVRLTAREFELIRLLAARPRTVHARSILLNRVFRAAESESIVDTYVHYLRRKLGNGVVRTVHGLGYQIGSL
jgi:two-component system response regulator QseB